MAEPGLAITSHEHCKSWPAAPATPGEGNGSVAYRVAWDEHPMRHGPKLRSGAMLMFGTGCEVLLPFVRSVALAHLISPTQFGLATALAVASGFAELVTDVGIHNAAMRQGGKNENGPRALDTLHTILLVRCGLLGLVLTAIGVPLAHFFHAPEAAWSFTLLGPLALLRGFMHMEVKEVMRDYVYGPDAISVVVGHVAWTVVTIGVAVVADDYRCMLYGLYAQTLFQIVATHLVSKTRFRLGWSREIARETLIYGAPMMPNGVALAVSGMGDRFLIGSFLGLNALALYNVAAMAAFMPRGVVLRLLMAVAVPTFINRGIERAASTRSFDYWAILLTVLSAFYALSFLCFGGVLVELVFGRQYALGQSLVSALALSVYLKFLLSLPAPPALAFGQTRLILLSSVLAACALAGGALAVFLTEHTLSHFILGVVAGEFLAVIWIVARSLKLYAFATSLTWMAVLLPIGVLAGAHYATAAIATNDVIMRIEIFVILGAVLGLGYALILVMNKLPIIPALLRRRLSKPA